MSWETHLGWEAQRAHFQWDTTGRDGPGRLVLVDATVDHAQLEGGYLHRAVMKGCRFARPNLQGSGLEDAELRDCVFDDGALGMGDWDRANVWGGTFTRCMFDLTHLDGASLQGTTFHRCSFARVTWDGARLTHVDLGGAVLTDGRFDGAVFTGCNLAQADFSRTLPLPRGRQRAVARDAVFERCDLRGANLEGLLLGNTRFLECRMEGVRGRPILEGRCEMTTVDVPAHALVAAWGAV
jgi:uncharacterized protein YjbI with pentapeptide repeats